MANLDVFPGDYHAARMRFRESASRIGWQLENHPIAATGPAGEQLTLDVASSPSNDPRAVLVVSSGLHGVEGFFGSAVQVALLEQFAGLAAGKVKCVFLHALNPFGFAWLRRFDEHNVDLNRNFLYGNDKYEGAPERYAELDRVLNPQRPPSYWDPFTLRFLWNVARHGMPALKRSVAEGQYEFPCGLFFGGTGPAQIHQLLAANLGRWLQGSDQIVHLDFHTGLGRKGTWKLLVDYPLSESQRDRLTNWFGVGSYEASDSRGVAYNPRGGLGRWCVSRNVAPDYLIACAEFGSYGPLDVIAGLRAENQAHHWGSASDPATIKAKRRLVELFCPADPIWRSRVLEEGVRLVNRALAGLSEATG